MNEKQLIEKIHSEFDSAQDRLLKEAHYILSSQNHSMVEMSERLKSVGFVNTPTAKKGNDAKHKLVKSRYEAELIEYYKTNYPFMKFLTEAELNRICKKYGLVHNSVWNYIGEVPTKNLTDIENAQPRNKQDNPEDLIYCEITKDGSFMILPGTKWPSIWESEWYKIPNRIDGKHFDSVFRANDYLRDKFGFKNEYLVGSVSNYHEDRQGLFICAPKSQFKGRKFAVSFVEVKDPIVFRYVRGGVQVITKWGLEANDPSLVVPILN